MEGTAPGHVTSPVANVDFWMELLSLLEEPQAVFLWVEVPSHIELEGNDRADLLAEFGRLASPLYLTRRLVTAARTPLQSLWGLVVGDRGATPKTAVEPTPLMASDEFTPLVLKQLEPLNSHRELTPLFHLLDFLNPKDLDRRVIPHSPSWVPPTKH